jgi:hypothetical protein
MYQLVGMGNKKALCDAVLFVGAVIKVGSVSLEVTNLCTKESDDFEERFAVEIGGQAPAPPPPRLTRRSVSAPLSGAAGAAAATAPGAGAGAGVGAGAGADAGTAPTSPSRAPPAVGSSRKPKSSGGASKGTARAGSGDKSDAEHDDGAHSEAEYDDGELSCENEDDAICYICWGGAGAGAGADGDSDQSEGGSGTSSGAEEDGGAAPADKKKRAKAAAALTLEERRAMNPLITNPCGKCSGSSRYVHLNCLLKWIKSSGSGHCSICNGPLPQHFSSPPPNIELKVVRHRRGQSWVGTRRFRISFAERDVAMIGRDQESDVRLTDRSVGSLHARITFNRTKRQFELADCFSVSGTFLQVKGSMELHADNTTYLKIGRTLLSLKMTQRKGTLLNMLQQLPWIKRS